MGGKTDQQNQAENLNSQYQELSRLIGSDENFDNYMNYTPAVGMEERSTALDDIYAKQGANMDLQTKNAVANAGNRTNRSLASRGIIGGSVVDDANAKSASGINNAGFMAKAKLGIGHAGQKLDVMNTENRLDLAGKGQGLNALNSKYGLMQGNLGGQSNLLSAYDNTTWLDDAFAGVNAVGNLASGGIPLAKELWS